MLLLGPLAGFPGIGGSTPSGPIVPTISHRLDIRIDGGQEFTVTVISTPKTLTVRIPASILG